MRHSFTIGLGPQMLFGAVLAALLVVPSNFGTQAAEKTTNDLASEKAIRATVESYLAAYNRADAKAVAAHWSDSGEWLSPSGQRVRGKQAIEAALRNLFVENKGVRIELVQPPSIRLISPEVALEEGTIRVIRPSAPPSESTYLAIHVKKDGQWKLDSVRETEVPDLSAASLQLQDLAWLVGDWGGEDPGAPISASVTWTKNKTFLNYSFKVSAPGLDDLEGTQVIGWDPAAGTIRSWMFDSDGGFGEGIWTKKDNAWIVKFSQALPDGRKASATNIYTMIDANTFTWKSIGRKVGDDFLPNVEEVKIVRKTAAHSSIETPKVVEKPPVREPKK